MMKLRLLLPLLTGIADALPLAFLVIAPAWPDIPTLVVMICSFGPPVVGICTLTILILLKFWKAVSLGSDGYRIASVLAAFGILEPLFYWI